MGIISSNTIYLIFGLHPSNLGSPLRSAASPGALGTGSVGCPPEAQTSPIGPAKDAGQHRRWPSGPKQLLAGWTITRAWDACLHFSEMVERG